MRRRQRPSFLKWESWIIFSMASFVASSIKEQVLTMRTSALKGSVVRRQPSFERRPRMTSESTKFLGHPRLTRQTLSFTEKIIAKQRRFSNGKREKSCFINLKSAKLFQSIGSTSDQPVAQGEENRVTVSRVTPAWRLGGTQIAEQKNGADSETV